MDSSTLTLFYVICTSLATISSTAVNAAEVCSIDGELRIVETASIKTAANNAGRLEVCYNGLWGTIASTTPPWSDKNVQVACRQLGFSGGLNSIYQNTVLPSDRPDVSVPVHFRNVMCDGLENRLDDCQLTIASDTSRTYDAFIVCKPTREISNFAYSPLHLPGPNDGDIRLVGSTNDNEGAVEVYADGIGWTGICPDSWTTNDAGAVCITLGYQTGSAIRFAFVAGVVNLPRATNVQCNYPWMTSLLSPIERVCNVSNTSIAGNCMGPSDVYAGVRCISRHRQGQFRLFDISSTESIVEVFYGSRWGAICSSIITSTTGQTVCRSFGFNNVGIYPLRAGSIMAYQKPIWFSEVDCSSAATTTVLENCPRSNIVGFSNCTNNIAVVICGDQSVPIPSANPNNNNNNNNNNDDDETSGNDSGRTIGLVVGLGVGLPCTFFIGISVCSIWCTDFFSKKRKCCLCGCCPAWCCKCCCDCCTECCCDCRTECCCACECGEESRLPRASSLAATTMRVTPMENDDHIREQEHRLQGSVVPVKGPTEPSTVTFKQPDAVHWSTAAKSDMTANQNESTAPTPPESHDPGMISAPPPSYYEALNYPKTR